MLQALVHSKLKSSFADPAFTPSEDTLTSSVIGLMQYLDDDMLWGLLRQACGRTSQLPETIGRISGIYFWDRWVNTEGTGNSAYVEPDVWIEATDYDVVIEAKKTDEWGQHEDQWYNELKALTNERDGQRPVIFIALGGNERLQDGTCEVDDIRHTIHTASWFNLLHAVTLCREKVQADDLPNHVVRLLNDIIVAFSKHGYVDVEWLSSMPHLTVSPSSAESLPEVFQFDNRLFFNDMYRPAQTNAIWKI